jgi:hypothetical protein
MHKQAQSRKQGSCRYLLTGSKGSLSSGSGYNVLDGMAKVLFEALVAGDFHGVRVKA